MYKKNILSAISVIGILCIAILLHIYRRRIWSIDKEEFFGGNIVEHMTDEEKKELSEELIPKLIEKIAPKIHDTFFEEGDKLPGVLPTNPNNVQIMGYVQKMLKGCMTAPGPQGIPGPRGPRGADGGKYTYTGYIESNDGKILQYNSTSQKNNTVTFVEKEKDKKCENCIWSIDDDGLINLYAQETLFLKTDNNGYLVVGGNPRDEKNTINKDYQWNIEENLLSNKNKIIENVRFTSFP